MLISILEFLFPKTVAAIRSKAYKVGQADMANIYVDMIRDMKRKGE